MIKELILSGSLAVSGGQSIIHDINLQLNSATWDYVDEIEDGSIYFLKSSLLDSQAIDVPNSNYSSGQDMILYHSNGWGNQRFVINKEGKYNGYNTYSIYPIESYDYTLSIESENAEDDKPLELKNVSNYGSNINSHKFILTPGTTTNSFKIATGSSDFTKYLTMDNYSVADGTKIIQKTYDSNFANCFDWYFQKTDSLCVNTKKETYINGSDQVHFNVRVPVTGEYVFETSIYDKELDTILWLYKDDGTLLKKDDDSGDGNFSKLTYKLDANQNYWIKLSGYSSSYSGNVYLTLKSLNTVYINTYHTDGDIDTRSDGVSPRNDLIDAGYYVRHIVNATRNDMLSMDNNGYYRLNNKYYMLSSHGSSSGAALLSSGQYLYGSNLPDMSNSILSVWAICYGGKDGNIAQLAVKNKNAQNALGFPGLTYVNTSKTFTDKLWSEIVSGKSISDSVNSALQHTKSTHWFTHMFGWGDDTIISPQLYSRVATNALLNNNDDYLLPDISNLSLSLSDSKSLLSFQKNNDTKTFEFNDASIIIKFKGNNPTNEYFVVLNENKILHHKVNIINNSILEKEVIYPEFVLNSNQKITLQNDYDLVINGIERTIRRIQYVTTNVEFETLNEIYIDLNTNQRFTETEIIDSFIQ